MRGIRMISIRETINTRKHSYFRKIIREDTDFVTFKSDSRVTDELGKRVANAFYRRLLFIEAGRVEE